MVNGSWRFGSGRMDGEVAFAVDLRGSGVTDLQALLHLAATRAGLGVLRAGLGCLQSSPLWASQLEPVGGCWAQVGKMARQGNKVGSTLAKFQVTS